MRIFDASTDDSIPSLRPGWCLAAEAALLVVALPLGWLWGTAPWERVAFDLAGWTVGIVATIPLLVPLLLPTRWLPGPIERFYREVQRLLGPSFRSWTVWQMLAISVLAGVGEELLFRGVLQPGLADWIGPWGAWLLASVLFGAVHFISPGYVVYATLMGLYLGGLTMWQENLLPAIVCHALYDLLALLHLAHGSRDAD